MSEDLSHLQEKIRSLKKVDKKTSSVVGVSGYNVALTMMTDLLSCVLVGLTIGLFLQKIFHTSALLTAGLTLIGGIAGFYTIIRFALNREKKQND